MKESVREILARKGTDVWSVGPEDSVFKALELMAEKEIGAVLVVDGERPVGILSERDYARKVVLEAKTSKQTRVREIMTPNPVCIRPNQTAEECMAVMTARRIRHLPVVEEGRLAGIISIGDVVKSIISDREFVIQQLESYITGG